MEKNNNIDQFTQELNALLDKYGFGLFHYEEVDIRVKDANGQLTSMSGATGHYDEKTGQFVISTYWDK